MVKRPNNLGDIFDKHLEFEFDKEDVDATMTTMTEDPYVHHVPTLIGGRGYDGVYNFYKNHFIGKMPKDLKITNVSRAFGKDEVVVVVRRSRAEGKIRTKVPAWLGRGIVSPTDDVIDLGRGKCGGWGSRQRS